MWQVSRHEIPVTQDVALKRAQTIASDAESFLDIVEQRTSTLRSVFSDALMAARYWCVVDPEAARIETWDQFVLAMQASCGVFVAAARPGEVIPMRLGRVVKQVTGNGPNVYTGAGSWLTTLWLSLVCRERDRTRFLANVPLDVLRGSGEREADYVYPVYSWVEALQLYWRQDPQMFDRLLEAMQGTNPEGLEPADASLVARVLFPPMKLFYYFTQRDAAAFNDALVEALELHREYWTATEERVRDSDGFIALAPLALACLARDAGMPIEVTSEYLPRYLLEGSWVGEYPTD